MKHSDRLLLALTLTTLASASVSLQAQSADSAAATPASDRTPELEAFILKETSTEESSTLLPTSRPIDSIYGSGRSILDIPRAVTVITPEALSQRGIDNVYDLAAVVPGASVINYYGVPGIPTTRGLFTSIYFNGMQRVFNRNGYPTSFGSLESLDYVRGPAPGNYSAASPGGFVNFVPKSPYFDKFRGSIEFTVGEDNEYKTQLDIGGPTLLGSKPAAYRVSLTRQDAESTYDGIFNDYTSVYASMKAQLSENVQIYTGGEYYAHRSKENPGWNRVTQNLIDNQLYLSGTAATDLTGASIVLPGVGLVVNGTPGAVSREALETATPFGGSRGNFGGSFLAQSGFASSGFNPALYSPTGLALYRTLGALAAPKLVKISRHTVLTDDSDFTNADTFLFFFDTIFTPSPDFKFTNKFFVDGFDREKSSSYGYAEYGKNTSIENKLLFENNLDTLNGIKLIYGVSARAEDALNKTEYTVEPFNRRDITVGATPNDTLFTGNQRSSSGRTFWDPFGSNKSKLLDTGFFFTPEISFTEQFSLILSARYDYVIWKRNIPSDLAFPNTVADPSDSKSYTNFSISPYYKLNDNITAYATVQEGTAFTGNYVSGAVDQGKSNFQESSLAEIGFKTSFFDNKLFAGIDYFYMELVNFDSRGGAAVPQRGRGVEFEVTYEPTRNFSITASATWQQHFYRSNTIPGGFIPLTEAELADFAGIFSADFGGRPNPGGPRFGIPEWSGSLFAKYQFDNGFGVTGGLNWTDSVFGNPDKTLTLPAYVLLDASIYYRHDNWEATLGVKNLTDELYFNPYDSFAANTIILPGAGRHYQVSLKYKF